ncbi:folate family ECF transporter S component [Terrisporobacter mayombei]|nr:folate family ECF transporter S component [Terrisporobacter mayombei]
MNKKFDVRKLVQISLLITLQIILTRYCSIQTPIVRISFGFVPVVIIAMLYGPVSCGIANGIADIIGVMLFPTGAFFPGFTLNAILAGVIYGIFLYNKPATWSRVLCALAVISIVVNLGLGTYWLSIMMGKGFIALLPARIFKEIVIIPVRAIVIGIIWKKIVVKFPKVSQA